ncbi:hypothetical protein NDU88_000293 [Pleurodeles waltl]|uniref:HSac2 domain-containing protein n=1 Tax=Pleurodeles waltl TaxID=8319 RepID=A0AAV7L843_PLEWA|nr:hypothetical protein NDU88_000293 [Pleurodeles waltl]
MPVSSRTGCWVGEKPENVIYFLEMLLELMPTRSRDWLSSARQQGIGGGRKSSPSSLKDLWGRVIQVQFREMQKGADVGCTLQQARHRFVEMSQTGDSEEFRPVELGSAGQQEIPNSGVEKGGEAASGEARDKEIPEAVARTSVELSTQDRQYLLRKFFVARPGALEQAVEDLKTHVTVREGETVLSFWLLAEVDHWNNEKERVVMITEKNLLICKYDFIMLACQQIQKVPLNYVDRICRGQFTFPPRSLDNDVLLDSSGTSGTCRWTQVAPQSRAAGLKRHLSHEALDSSGTSVTRRWTRAAPQSRGVGHERHLSDEALDSSGTSVTRRWTQAAPQ